MSQELNGKVIGAIIGAAALGAVAVTAPLTSTPQTTSTPAAQTTTTVAPEKKDAIEARPVYQPRVAADRSWGSLSAREIAALHEQLKWIPKEKVRIFSSGNYAKDLAEDLDEVFESAGFDSYLENPLIDPGKGIGISPANERSRAIATAISQATNGRLNLGVFDAVGADGKPVGETGIVIVLARRKPPKT